MSTSLPPSLPVFLDVVDEAVGAGVVASGGCGSTQLRLDDLGQLFPQLNATIVPTVNDLSITNSSIFLLMGPQINDTPTTSIQRTASKFRTRS